MNFSALSATEIVLICAAAMVVVIGVTSWLLVRKRRTARLRTQFGGDE